jgi:hypothetical protein
MPAGRLQILKVLIITYVVVFGEIPRQLTGPFTAVHMGKSDSPAAPVSNKRANPNPLIVKAIIGPRKKRRDFSVLRVALRQETKNRQIFRHPIRQVRTVGCLRAPGSPIR